MRNKKRKQQIIHAFKLRMGSKAVQENRRRLDVPMGGKLWIRIEGRPWSAEEGRATISVIRKYSFGGVDYLESFTTKGGLSKSGRNLGDECLWKALHEIHEHRRHARVCRLSSEFSVYFSDWIAKHWNAEHEGKLRNSPPAQIVMDALEERGLLDVESRIEGTPKPIDHEGDCLRNIRIWQQVVHVLKTTLPM